MLHFVSPRLQVISLFYLFFFLHLWFLSTGKREKILEAFLALEQFCSYGQLLKPVLLFSSWSQSGKGKVFSSIRQWGQKVIPPQLHERLTEMGRHRCEWLESCIGAECCTSVSSPFTLSTSRREGDKPTSRLCSNPLIEWIGYLRI